jgi:hypothetical protein
MCLVAGIGLASQSPLGVLFIFTLLTVYIVSNWFISKSLRKRAGLQMAAEIMLCVFVILLQMSVINATTVGNAVWNGLAWTMFCLALGSLILLTIFTLA